MFSLIEVKRYKRKYLGAPDPRIGYQLVSRMFLPWKGVQQNVALE